MKAGKVGSNPDGAANPANTISFALTVFLKDIGDSVSNLNTIVVGLDAVENGHKKPDNLDISWNPSDRQIAARKARKFTVESVLVYVAEALNQYIIAIEKLPRLDKNREVLKLDGLNKADRLTVVSQQILPPDDNYLIASSALLIHWRNRIVHPNSSAKLSHDHKKILIGKEDYIQEKYKNLSVTRLLAHFEESKPTLKDVSSLISMAINLVKKIDEMIFKNFSKEDLQAWLDHYDITSHIEKIKKETKPEKMEASIERVFKAQAPSLLDLYNKYFL